MFIVENVVDVTKVEKEFQLPMLTLKTNADTRSNEEENYGLRYAIEFNEEAMASMNITANTNVMLVPNYDTYSDLAIANVRELESFKLGGKTIKAYTLIAKSKTVWSKELYNTLKEYAGDSDVIYLKDSLDEDQEVWSITNNPNDFLVSIANTEENPNKDELLQLTVDNGYSQQVIVEDQMV